jgi:hypothetical protein
VITVGLLLCFGIAAVILGLLLGAKAWGTEVAYRRLAWLASLKQRIGAWEEWKEMIHVFPLFVPEIPESKQAVREVGRFARRHLSAT